MVFLSPNLYLFFLPYSQKHKKRKVARKRKPTKLRRTHYLKKDLEILELEEMLSQQEISQDLLNGLTTFFCKDKKEFF